MRILTQPLSEAEMASIAATVDDAGLGALSTERGNLPLETLDVHASITGLTARTVLTQGFRNPHDAPLEATYVFPLPDRAAVTALRMEADGRVVDGVLKERAEARAAYDQAISEGKRASIAEEERPDVFTMRVGNILPGEQVIVRLTLVGPLPYEDGEATYRFPLVVAPRYIPGTPLPGESVGVGVVSDTDAVPDASRISPPVLLPGFPNPVRLSIAVDVDAAGLPLSSVRSSLHATTESEGTVRIQPGERVDRDFLLRLTYGEPDATVQSLVLAPDAAGEEGTFQLTVLPPAGVATAQPRDVVLLLDRSGSMSGWKMIAARRAAARIVDTLTSRDRFAVLSFDHEVVRPAHLPSGLVEATDRHRFRAVEHLAGLDARGGTEMLAPLQEAVSLLGGVGEPGVGGDGGRDHARDHVIVLVTDGQVGNEDQILAELSGSVRHIRMHTVGIDQAVNVGFLNRLAAAGGGRCELVESEDRLDAAMDRIHRRIGAPLVTGLALAADGFNLAADTVAPARLADLFPGVPLVVTGRWRGTARPAKPAVEVTGRTVDGQPWSVRVDGVVTDNDALTVVWARAHLRDLEDRYVVSHDAELERRILDVSLRFGVLCRFTAFVAIDTRVVTEGGKPHQVVQPVELPAGWEFEAADGAMPAPMAASLRMAAAPMPPGVGRSALRSFHSAALAPESRAPMAMPDQASLQGFAPPPGSPMPPGDRASLTPFADELAAARTQAAEEARRLREAVDISEYDRCATLADLGSRLDAMTRHLRQIGVPLEDLAALSQLVEDLAVCEAPTPPRGDSLDRLWEHTLAVLDTFADSETSTPPADAARQQPPRRSRGAFWKGG